MSVFKQARGKTYRYKFYYDGKPHTGNTHQREKDAAEAVEAKVKLQLRKHAGGLQELELPETPTFTAWAGATLAYQTKFITRPDILDRTLTMVLAFWGAEPTTPTAKPAVARQERAPRPYHNLRLGDPIVDPNWLQKFETWMEARGIGASARNSYLSACSDMYTCAMQPQFRALTGITTNPFAGIRRSPTRDRTVALTVEQILALIGDAGPHIAHALCIAALAPKLRVSSILNLQWAEHLDADLTTITVTEHKTSAHAGAQRVPISAQLRAILLDIKAGQDPASPYVITWRGEPIASIKTGLRRAVERVGLTWGLKDGVTFHVMRHSVATILADPELVGALTERLRADVMGHREIRTTQKYTHLNTAVQKAPHEALSAVLPGLRAAATRPPKGPASRVKSMTTKTNQIELSQTTNVVRFARPNRKKTA